MNSLDERINSPESIDRKSFILGMITAFSECVARECKKAAFSPPFYPGDFESIHLEATRIAQEQGLDLWYEENKDIPTDQRVCWFVIFKFPEVLEEYKNLRNEGFNPAYEFNEFHELLSYGTVYGENSDLIEPKMRKLEETDDPVSRILFQPGEWPLTK